MHARLLTFVLIAASVPAPSLAQDAPAPSPTPTLAPGTVAPALSGVVSSERGPVTSATVKIAGPVTRTYTTAPDGVFRFDRLPAGTYSLTVRASGYESPAASTVTVVAGTPQTLTVSLAAATLNSLRTIASTTVAGRGTVTINRSGAAESTLTSQDYIARGDAQVQNELEELPGVELTRASSGGAPGANTDVALRGASTYETQTLIDGHPVTGGRFGTYLIQFLNPLVLGDIEVDKGPGVMGNTIANAIGGTVNFRTPNITSTLTGRATAGYDSFNGSTYSARISDTLLDEKIGFLAAYGFNGTPGYFTGNILSVDAAGNSAPGAAPPLASVITSIPATETYQNRSQVFKIAANFSKTTSLTLGSIGEQTFVDYTATLDTVEPFTIAPCIGAGGPNCAGASGFNNPGYNGLIGHTVLASSTSDNLYLGNFEIDNEPIFTADLKTSFGPGSFLGRFYTGSINRNIDDPEEAQQIISCPQVGCTAPMKDSAFYQGEVDRLHGVDAEYSLPIGRSGQDLAQVSYDQHGDQALYCSGSSALLTGSECSINNLLLTSRTYSIRAFAAVAPKVQVGFGNYFSDTTFVGSRYDPRATIVWTPQRNTAVRFAVGTAYVAPPVDFVSPVSGVAEGATKAVINNTLYVSDSLKPETSAGINLGADFGIHGDSKFTVDAYETALTNRFSTITLRPPSALPSYDPFGFYNGTPFTKVIETYNASDANEEGIELTYTRRPVVGIGGTAEIDLLRAYNYNTVIPSFGSGINATAAQTGTIGGDALETPGFQIPGFPYSHGRAELTYTEPNSNNYRFGATIYGANNSFGEPGFTVFDASTNLKLRYGVRLNVSVTNIFDHDDNRTLGEYGYGYLPPGESTPYSLFFYPPRRLNLQLVFPFGDR